MDHDEMSFHSKRICIHTKICSNICENFKIVFKGKVHWIRAKEATGWIPEFSEDEEDDDHSEQEFISSEQSDLGLHIDGEDNGASEVPETIFENSNGMKERQSEDPFGLYSILNKNKVKSCVEKNGSKSKDDQVQNISDNQLNGDNESVHQVEREDNRNSDGAKTNSTGSRKFKMSEIPRTGGSILSVMEEIVKVGITMGLAQKAKKDWVKELCNKNKVSFVGLQETKMESIDLLSVRLCWGNVNFDYVHSDSIGNSRGILCIWDPNSFRKDSVTVSDYFVIVRGLEEVPLGGSAYTWCHKSASKMSKLDRFLVSENLLNTCPNISAITLDRFLSDHRPILLHSWKDTLGMISNAWRNCVEELRILDELMIKVMDSDEMLTKVEDSLRNSFRFRIRFDKPPDQNAHIDMPFPNSLSTDQQKDLECMVSKEEVKRRLWDYGNRQITENPDANMVKDFRPISLIGSIYKIIAKILTNRLVGVLGDIVNEVQFDFLSEETNPCGPMYERLGENMSRVHAWKRGRAIFHMSIYKVPSSVLHLLESIRSHFFHGHDPRSKKASWVNWNKAIHGPEGGLITDVRRGFRSTWTSIVQEVKKLQNQGVNIFDYIRIKIGNGDNTSFWKDKWHNEGVLKDVFPRLYALERHQNVTIHTKLIDYSLVNSFRRNPRSGVEEFQLDNLSRLVNTITLSSAVDRYVWSLENSGEFSVKSIRQVIDANCFPVIHSVRDGLNLMPIKVDIMA
ncbi:RNA-directed DNA polymerase, eukaryota, reverse transcriptase zinc-binding domain protein [Tanacetum coccineum]